MNTNQPIDTLVFVVVENDLSAELSGRLIQSGFYFTLIKSGDALLDNSVTLLIGIPGARLDDLMELIHTHCRRRQTYVPTRVDAYSLSAHPIMIEAEAGGALIYIHPVERFIQI